MKKNVLVASVVGAVASFLLGWIVYGMLLMDFYSANSVQYDGMMKEQPMLGLIFTSQLATAFLLATIYDSWSKAADFSAGFRQGMLIGLLITLSMDLYFMASMNFMTWTLVGVDIVVGSLFTGVVGGVIALVLGKMAAKS